MDNGLPGDQLRALPVQEVRELDFERLEIALQGRFVGQLGIFPDQQDRDVAGIIWTGGNIALHRARKEVLLLLDCRLELCIQSFSLTIPHLDLDLQRVNPGARAVDTPGRGRGANAPMGFAMKLLNGAHRNHIASINFARWEMPGTDML